MPCCKTRSSSPCFFASTTNSRRNVVLMAVDAVAIFIAPTTRASREAARAACEANIHRG
jgi:hypothetical protein